MTICNFGFNWASRQVVTMGDEIFSEVDIYLTSHNLQRTHIHSYHFYSLLEYMIYHNMHPCSNMS